MDFDDVALCYLFMQASGATKEKSKEFDKLKEVAKLGDWEEERLSDFQKEFKMEESARNKLSEMFSDYTKSLDSSSSLSSLMKDYGIGGSNDDESRWRVVLWWLIRLSYASENRPDFDDEFLKDFTSQMKIDETCLQEMKDTMEVFLILDKKPQWAESVGFSTNEISEYQKEINSDEDTLNDSIYDLVFLD